MCDDDDDDYQTASDPEAPAYTYEDIFCDLCPLLFVLPLLPLLFFALSGDENVLSAPETTTSTTTSTIWRSLAAVGW